MLKIPKVETVCSAYLTYHADSRENIAKKSEFYFMNGTFNKRDYIRFLKREEDLANSTALLNHIVVLAALVIHAHLIKSNQMYHEANQLKNLTHKWFQEWQNQNYFSRDDLEILSPHAVSIFSKLIILNALYSLITCNENLFSEKWRRKVADDLPENKTRIEHALVNGLDTVPLNESEKKLALTVCAKAAKNLPRICSLIASYRLS